MFDKKNKIENQNDAQQKAVGVNEQDQKNKEYQELNNIQKEYQSPSNNQNSLKDVEGILIYEEAKKKLNISEDGKIYRQKFFNYLPVISIISVLIYVNYVFGKTKCLKDNDHTLFRRAHFWTNIVGFLIMPLVGIALWTFGTWMVYDVLPGVSTNYSNLWTTYINSIKDAETTFIAIGEAIGGLFRIAIAPLLVPTQIIAISGTKIPTNIIFIIVFVIFTIVNPVNIIFTYIMNSKMLRFITVSETSSIYRYRK